MKKPKKVLILGSGALQIGQAGEFDFSGSQALKSLREEGIKTVLINPNIATIQTSSGMADKIYFVPVNTFFVEKVIKQEKPDALMLSFGGQTALNCGVDLFKKGILKKYNVKVLGTSVRTIMDTEDRDLFKKKMAEINITVPTSVPCSNEQEALKAIKKIGFPVMIRGAYALGGEGSGIARNLKTFKPLIKKAFNKSPQILVEEYLHGWKEIEYEVVRDIHDNCITVCNMENFDPLGIHTGESIVVAPSQTLNNNEYHLLRTASIKIIKHLQIVGECNVQFALDPYSKKFKVIEVNERLSRSSALASKATGYPLAYIAAKLGLGYGLPELKNSVTKKTTACFEPALDYIVVKIPVWDFKKFLKVSDKLGSEMKSVGEVMAVGKTFEEGLQKALRMVGFNSVAEEDIYFRDLKSELKNPSDKRLFAVARAFAKNMPADEIYNLTRIDNWFLYKIKNIVSFEKKLKKLSLAKLDKNILRKAKELGFSDKRIAFLIDSTEKKVREKRYKEKVLPVIKQIDTLAAEFPAKTNYLYSTYHGIENDLKFNGKKQVIVLGSGAYRIGSSVEFDWCAVNAVKSLQKQGYNAIMINFNPETVSTDYDVCSKLYFEELSLETVLDICKKEKPLGVVVSVGGQTANNLALKLSEENIKILGTPAKYIDSAEDRNKFSKLCDSLEIDQPKWMEAKSLAKALEFASKVKYPVLVRPSYVLSGLGMSVVYSKKELNQLLKKAAVVSSEYPVVISKFIENAKEFDVDAVANKGKVVAYAISEHIEKAGVHSVDSTMVFPSQKINDETKREVLRISVLLAKRLKITGPFNIQFMAKRNQLKLIECNLRCSRSFPFISKVSNNNFIDIAIRGMIGKKVKNIGNVNNGLTHLGVKVPQFSFSRLKGADPVLNVQMASTGEVACIDNTLYKALLKGLIATGFPLHVKGILIAFSSTMTTRKMIETLENVPGTEHTIYATRRTIAVFKEFNINHFIPVRVSEKNSNELESLLASGKINLVISVPNKLSEKELAKDYVLRRKSADYKVPVITDESLAKKVLRAVLKTKIDSLNVKPWKDYFK